MTRAADRNGSAALVVPDDVPAWLAAPGRVQGGGTGRDRPSVTARRAGSKEEAQP